MGAARLAQLGLQIEVQATDDVFEVAQARFDLVTARRGQSESSVRPDFGQAKSMVEHTVHEPTREQKRRSHEHDDEQTDQGRSLSGLVSVRVPTTNVTIPRPVGAKAQASRRNLRRL